MMDVQTTALPTLGAATTLAEVALNRDWFFERPRDIEIGDAVKPALLDSPDLQQAYLAQATDVLRDFPGRIGIHGPFMGMLINSPDPLFQQLVARRFMESIQFSAQFGASQMVIHSPFQGWTNPFIPFGAGSNREQVIGWIRATLEPVLPVCEKHGVTMVMENIRDLSIMPILETVRSIDSPHLKVSLDVGHAQLHTRSGGITPDQYIREAGDLLEHVHLQDVDGEFDRHWAPGDGSIAWYGIFRALTETGSSPRLILEMKDKTTVQRGARYLRERGLAQ